jgi:hypothetical protein
LSIYTWPDYSRPQVEDFVDHNNINCVLDMVDDNGNQIIFTETKFEHFTMSYQDVQQFFGILPPTVIKLVLEVILTHAQCRSSRMTTRVYDFNPELFSTYVHLYLTEFTEKNSKYQMTQRDIVLLIDDLVANMQYKDIIRSITNPIISLPDVDFKYNTYHVVFCGWLDVNSPYNFNFKYRRLINSKLESEKYIGKNYNV